MSDQRETAIHEAGHAVAHVRLNILQGRVTIVPNDGRLGSSTAEGSDSVTSATEAADQVLAYCAGYAACIAAGFDRDTAALGCWDDFEQAQELVDFWSLDGNLDEWRDQAVAMMSSTENIAAVALVAKWLLQDGTVDEQLLDVLVERADGNIDDEELKRFLAIRSPLTRA